ncbi:claret isoform a [Anaeramoeba ignava]|uniref:Claret isoform a n=1 Tax=Anaeramoeba ignava TaxID=1746090 RepID=A0A9Q0LN43_ANAIG|nr:claret isoform a [Anaeramoeba ignava]
MNEILFFGANQSPILFKNEPNQITKPIQFKFENENEKQIKQILSSNYSVFFLFENGKTIKYSEDSNQNPEKEEIQIENIQKVTVGNENEAILTIEGNIQNDRIIQDIVSGSFSIYLLTSNQNVYGIGSNDYGQLGFDSKTLEIIEKPILMMKNVSKIFSGNSSNCVFLLNSNQELFGCGDNEYGQLGLGESIKERRINKLIKIQNIPKGKIIDIQCGYFHSVMLIENQNQNPKRKLYSCGFSLYNGLGKNENVDNYEFTEIKSSLFENENDDILDFSVGNDHTLILTSNSKLIGFGNNSNGQLGTGNTDKQLIPIQIELPKLRFNEEISNYHIYSGISHSFLYYFPSFSNLEEDLIKLFRKEKNFVIFHLKPENGEIIKAHKLILKYRLNQNQNEIEKLQEIISKIN